MEEDSAACRSEETMADSNNLEFPYANLYELENRVFCESWSIPYKKEESLAICLQAATRLAEESKYSLSNGGVHLLFLQLVLCKLLPIFIVIEV